MQLIYAPSDWLSKSVKPFDFEKIDAVKTAQGMVDIMEANKGIGISANQVGLDGQIFILKPHEMEGYDKSFAIINPEIIKIDDRVIEGEEGCLSYPGLYFKVKRATALVAKCLDSAGKECTIEFVGYNARIFQHEYDHLQGINFTDRVSKLRLDMALKKQKKLFKKYKVDIKW